jgi:predicted ferric reductase
LQTVWNVYEGEALKYDFKGYPAVTGYLLWVVIIAFCCLSSNYVRRKAFEWFFYPHLLLIILWAVFLVAHGGLQWFGFGLPLACISVIPAVLVYFVERYFHVSWGSDETIHIARATVTDKMVMVTVDIGNSNLSYETGQYSMLKVPDLAVHEWHPFTIASGGRQQQFDLLIAVAGDWTQKLHDVLEDAQQKHDAMVNASTNRENAVHSKPAYPKICVRGGYGAPAEGMQGKSYVVMVGGGVGATPFLSFLSAACNAAQMHENVIFPGLKSAVFFWVSRDPQDFRWVNTYSSIIAKNPSLARRIQIKLCLTKTLESIATEDVSKEAVSLFWLGIQRAMRNQNKNKELAAMLGVPTQFGRPDWDQEFRHISNKLQKSEDMMMDERFEISVFACGNPMLTESLEKACAANTDKNVKMRLYAEEF